MFCEVILRLFLTMRLMRIVGFVILLTQSMVLSSWDFAVTTKSKILFYDDQWREVTASAHQFEQLSAITFDETEEVIYFNDKLHNNGSIFSLKLPIIPQDIQQHIIENVVQRTQKESIGGIAFDPLNRNLFWTDAHNKKIYLQSIDATAASDRNVTVLLDLTGEDSKPDGLAIDICRRKLYWTNANFRNATIERIDLDGSERETIVRSDLYLPHGIVIDQLSDRIYWVVDQQGTHFSVESANLDGSDRVAVVKGLNNVPFNLAVTKDSIFWTDLTNNAIWGHAKYTQSKLNENNDTIESDSKYTPEKIISFKQQPRGLVARTRYLKTLQNDEHCSVVVKKLRQRLLMPKPMGSNFVNGVGGSEKLRRDYCLNNGDFSEVSGVCICKIGYDGTRCETSECHNYCVHGTCGMDAMGFPKCVCQRGFYGERCQAHKCDGYCMNDGVCELLEQTAEPSCECKERFGGKRCEQNSTDICALFCRILKYEPETYVPFGCHDICEDLAAQTENGAETYMIPKYQHLEVCHNSNAWNRTIVVLVSGVVLSLCLVLLIVHGLRRFYKPARPRIKKTFVVKKHSGTDTPLTNRPLATEQCEITIENCCNMNICDTPCFDPKLLQQNMARETNTKEDKIILIHNMDDELY